jgi:rubredoxin
MKGRLKCNACGHVFDVSEATFTFELGGDDRSGTLTCPECQSEDVEPA